MAYTKKEVFTGLLWSGLDKFGFVAIQLILELILARLLLPEHYDIIGIVLIFTSFSLIIAEGGFSNALIQKLNRTETDYSTVFYANLLIAVFIYLLIFVSAPFFESFFEKENLSTILRWVGLTVILNATTVVHKTKLSIAMNFRLQAKVSLISVFLSGCVAVYLAYQGYGVWALVIQFLLMTLLNTILLWIGFRWIPSLEFSAESLKKLFSFGSKILASSVMQSAFFNMYPFVIGRSLPAGSLGLYVKSNQFTQMPSSVLTTVLQRVLFPFFSSHQKDNEKVYHLHLFYSKLCAMFLMPIFFLLAIFAEKLIPVVFSQNWASMSEVFMYLAIAYSFYPLIVQNMTLLQVKNKTSLFLNIEIGVKLLGLIILFFSLQFGLTGIVLGIAVHQFFQFLISSSVIQLVLSKSVFGQVIEILPIILWSAFLFLIFNMDIVDISSLSWENIIFTVIILVLSYLILHLLFYRKMYYDIRLMLRSKS